MISVPATKDGHFTEFGKQAHRALYRVWEAGSPRKAHSDPKEQDLAGHSAAKAPSRLPSPELSSGTVDAISWGGSGRRCAASVAPLPLNVCAGQSPLLSLELWGPCVCGRTALSLNHGDSLNPSPKGLVPGTGGKRPLSPDKPGAGLRVDPQ